MENINRILDWLYYDCISPLFSLLGKMLSLVLIQPLAALHVPVWLHVTLLAMLTAWFSFWLRRLLGVEEKVRRFNAVFAEKRRRQKNLQLISDKYSREALYKVTDDDLNSDFNTYLAHHYARYVTVYMLPVFLILAWLNTVFTDTMLMHLVGVPFVLRVPENNYGVAGLSVSFVFLIIYVLCLIAGFQIRRRRTSS